MHLSVKKEVALIAVLLCGCMSSSTQPTATTDAPEAPSRQKVLALEGPGREVMYRFLDEGDVESADHILENRWPVTRFEPVALPAELTWTENPFNEKYWRFEFYGLRPLRHLVRAWVDTGDARYRAKLIQVLEGFVQRGHASPYAWDKHTAAFRGMSLVNIYVKLKSRGALPAALDQGLREKIQEVGQFLHDPENYEGDYNHGLAQTGALLLIAENFPEFPSSPAWRATAIERLDDLLTRVLDEDGVEVEQSPFYHFYFLTGFWEVFRWANENGIELSAQAIPRIHQMLRYAAHIVLPDGEVPMVGTSVARNVRKSQDTPRYMEMAELEPGFKYVLTAGQEGAPPEQTRILFPSSGQAVLRSSFGDTTDFLAQTHLLFDVGPYRTSHSHLDALSLQLYSDGRTLLPDSGHFTNEPGPEFDYFSGTRAHNTVVVDGLDQRVGSARAGRTAGTGTWGYQSGEHTLYDGVVHKRAVLMLRRSLVVVVDELDSADDHTYEQTWHLFPDAELQTDGLTATALDSKTGKPLLTIHQLSPTKGLRLQWVRGSTEPLDGWYSERFEIKVPNYSLKYRRRATRAVYITVLAAGAYAGKPLYGREWGNTQNRSLFVCVPPGLGYEVTISDVTGPKERVTVKKVLTPCPSP